MTDNAQLLIAHLITSPNLVDHLKVIIEIASAHIAVYNQEVLEEVTHLTDLIEQTSPDELRRLL